MNRVGHTALPPGRGCSVSEVPRQNPGARDRGWGVSPPQGGVKNPPFLPLSKKAPTEVTETPPRGHSKYPPSLRGPPAPPGAGRLPGIATPIRRASDSRKSRGPWPIQFSRLLLIRTSYKDFLSLYIYVC